MKTNDEIKIQLLLMEYITADISPDDKLYFIENIKKYPDLFEEYKQINLFFDNTEKADMNNYMMRKSVNISVDVIDTMKNRANPKNSFFSGIKYASISALAIILIVIGTNINYNQPNSNSFLGIEEDTELLSAIADTYEEYYNTTSNDIFDLDDTYFENESDEYSIEINEVDAYELMENGSINYEFENIQFDNMNENELNKLFEDIENEKII